MKGLFNPNVKKFACLLLIMAVLFSFVSCADASPGSNETTGPETSDPNTQTQTTDATEPSDATDPTETKATEPKETQPKETEPEETKGTDPTEAATKPTEPKETEPKATEPPATQPPATEPPATKPPETKPVETTPPETQPPVTEPPATEPPHEHSYSASNTVAAACNSQGYTIYTCSCGASYSDNYTPVTGHSWGEWTTTKEATSEAEGQQARTCASCGTAETQAIAKLPAETIDTAALADYGRQYGASTYGFNPVIGTRAGYFPGYCCRFTSMSDAYQEVAECVAATAEQLIAAGKPIVVEFEGKMVAFRLDIEVVHDHDDIYYVWVYYG